MPRAMKFSMLPRIQTLRLEERGGAYEAVPGDSSEGKGADGGGAPRRRTSFLWLYLTLSAFAGFVVAITMVNLFPESLIQSSGDKLGGNSKLRKLLQCTSLLLSL